MKMILNGEDLNLSFQVLLSLLCQDVLYDQLYHKDNSYNLDFNGLYCLL